MTVLMILARWVTGYDSPHHWTEVKPGHRAFAYRKLLTRLEVRKSGICADGPRARRQIALSKSLCVHLFGKPLGTLRAWLLMQMEFSMRSGLTTVPASKKCGQPPSR